MLEGFGEGVGFVIGLIQVLPLNRGSALECCSSFLALLLHPKGIGGGDELICCSFVLLLPASEKAESTACFTEALFCLSQQCTWVAGHTGRFR